MKWNIWIVELNDYKCFNGENCEYTLGDLVDFYRLKWNDITVRPVTK
jgi:hypothetical protein